MLHCASGQWIRLTWIATARYAAAVAIDGCRLVGRPFLVMTNSFVLLEFVVVFSDLRANSKSVSHVLDDLFIYSQLCLFAFTHRAWVIPRPSSFMPLRFWLEFVIKATQWVAVSSLEQVTFLWMSACGQLRRTWIDASQSVSLDTFELISLLGLFGKASWPIGKADERCWCKWCQWQMTLTTVDTVAPDAVHWMTNTGHFRRR